MNLTLYKPNYAMERKRDRIRYHLLGEYMKKSKKKFKEGMKNELEPFYFSKKHYEVNSVEHRYEMNTIIKRFWGTISPKGKQKPKQTLCASPRLTKQLSNNISTTAKSGLLMTQQVHLSGDHPLSFIEQGRCFSHNNLLTPNSTPTTKLLTPTDKQQHNQPSTRSNITVKRNKNSNNPFIQLDPYENVYDRNVLFEKLKHQCAFFKKDSSHFDRTKWKMFRMNSNPLSCSTPSKHSTQRIKVMFMRNKIGLTLNH